MTPIAAIRGRLREDDGLPALLDTAYAAFELLLTAIEEHEYPATGMFAQFVRSMRRYPNSTPVTERTWHSRGKRADSCLIGAGAAT